MNAWTVVKRNPLICMLALLAAAALVVVTEAAYWRAQETIARIEQGQLERFSVRELQIAMLEAESAQRGYLLTNRKIYLQPYAGAVQEVNESLDELERYYAGALPLQPTLVALRRAAQAKLTEMAQTIRLLDEGQTAAAQALLASDIGKVQMAAIRQLTSDLLGNDTRMRTANRAALQTTLGLSRVGVTTLALIGLLALFLYLRHGLAVQTHELELKLLARVERERLEVEVVQRTAELTELARHLLTAREDERNRLARDLHDDLGALLTSAKLDAARIRSRLGDGAPEAQERLAHLVETLNSSIALGRRIIEDLRPSTLANLGLVASLEILAREFGARSGVTVHCNLAPVELSATAELVVYRLVQEAITNLSKYAKANQVWIELGSRDGRVEASVRDNGVGFDSRQTPGSAFGLLGMRYRVEAEQGTLSVVSRPGQGTTVSVDLPARVA